MRFAEDTCIRDLPDEPGDRLRIVFIHQLDPFIRSMNVSVFSEMYECRAWLSRPKNEGASAMPVSKLKWLEIDDAWPDLRENTDGCSVAKKSIKLIRAWKDHSGVIVCSLGTTHAAAKKAISDDVLDYCWTFPIILHFEVEVEDQLPFLRRFQSIRYGINNDVRPVQRRKGDFASFGLNTCLFARVQPEPFSGYVETPRDNSQNGSKENQKRVSNFDPITTERRPELGSLLASLLTVIGGMVGGRQAWRFRRGWRSALCFGFGSLMILDGTIGFLFGLDGWSIYRWWSLG